MEKGERMKKAIVFAICLVFFVGGAAAAMAGEVKVQTHAGVVRNNGDGAVQTVVAANRKLEEEDRSCTDSSLEAGGENPNDYVDGADNPGSCDGHYKSSDLPEWDFKIAARVGREGVRYQFATNGAQYEGDYNTFRLSVNALRDRFLLFNEFRFETFVGVKAYKGMDSRAGGWRMMPGYKLLTQRENGLEIILFGILDVSYFDPDNAAGQWRISPGALLSVGRKTFIGLFQGAYTFSSSKNYNNDVDVTGNDTINIHGLAFDYSLQLFKWIYASAGVSHVFSGDTRAGMEDKFTNANIGVGTIPGAAGNWILRIGYFQSVDGNGNYGVDFKVGFVW